MDPVTHSVGVAAFTTMLAYQLLQRWRRSGCSPNSRSTSTSDDSRDLSVQYYNPQEEQLLVQQQQRRQVTTDECDHPDTTFSQQKSSLIRYGTLLSHTTFLSSPLARYESSLQSVSSWQGTENGVADGSMLGRRPTINLVAPSVAAGNPSRAVLRHARCKDQEALAEALVWLDRVGQNSAVELDSERETRIPVPGNLAERSAVSHPRLSVSAPFVVPFYPPTSAEVEDNVAPGVDEELQTSYEKPPLPPLKRRREGSLDVNGTLRRHRVDLEIGEPSEVADTDESGGDLAQLATILAPELAPPPSAAPATQTRRSVFLRHRRYGTNPDDSKGPRRSLRVSVARAADSSSGPQGLQRRLSMVQSDN